MQWIYSTIINQILLWAVPCSPHILIRLLKAVILGLPCSCCELIADVLTEDVDYDAVLKSVAFVTWVVDYDLLKWFLADFHEEAVGIELNKNTNSWELIKNRLLKPIPLLSQPHNILILIMLTCVVLPTHQINPEVRREQEDVIGIVCSNDVLEFLTEVVYWEVDNRFVNLLSTLQCRQILVHQLLSIPHSTYLLRVLLINTMEFITIQWINWVRGILKVIR